MLEVFLLLLSIALFAALLFTIKKLFSLKQELEDLRFQKSSQAVRYGKLTEQFIPFTEQFPFDPALFRFLGEPVDGIIFDSDSVVFCEFKTGKSQLSQKQRRIKELVESGKVKWLEFRLR
jgi:predicted Holliday junction resolvase-like endonuclease